MNNERGFLASSVLYVMLGLFLILMIGVIDIYSNRKALLDRVKDDIVRGLEYGIEKEETTIIDNEAPSLNLVVAQTTTKTILVRADANATSGISKYEFKIDAGEWNDAGESSSYQFSDLKTGTEYNVCAKVTSGSNKTAEDCKQVTTNTLGISFTVSSEGVTNTSYGWAEKKTVDIKYSRACGVDGISCDYSYKRTEGVYDTVDGKNNVTSGDNASYTFNSKGILTATISDGKNIHSESITILRVGKAATQLINNGVVTSGNGLYCDTYEDTNNCVGSDCYCDRFVFKGRSPANYAVLKDATLDYKEAPIEDYFRIVAIEPDGTIKLVRNFSYFTGVVWASSASANWINSSAINMLNTTYLNTFANRLEIETTYWFRTNREWYVGNVNYDADKGQDLKATIADEKSERISNNNYPFGLLGITDYIRASNSSTCKTIDDSRTGQCYNNWLWRSSSTKYAASHLATMSTSGGNTEQVMLYNPNWYGGTVTEETGAGSMSAGMKTSATYGLRPVGYYDATSEITGGTGVSATPYEFSTY